MPLKAGDIVEDYPYLWLRQRRTGETEGRKPRPVCVAVVVTSGSGKTHLALLAISSRPPTAAQLALPVSESERRRIGIDASKPAWVYVGEYNYDILEDSFYLPRKLRPTKSVSPKFLKHLLVTFKTTLTQKSGRVTRL
jgi:hypothetical protein